MNDITKETLGLIDLSAIFARNWHAYAAEAASEAKSKTIGIVLEAGQNYDHVAVCCDAPPYLRSNVLPEYKGNREKKPIEFVEMLRAVKADLRDRGFILWESEGYEADDVIATAVKHAGKDFQVFIHSADKDLMQLVSENVSQVSTATNERYDVEKVTAKFGVPPKAIRALLSIIGDTSDNIPGVKGVGVKTAAQWLNWEDLDLFKVLTSNNIGGAKGAAMKAMSNQICINYELVGLSDDVPFAWGDLFADEKVETVEVQEAVIEEPSIDLLKQLAVSFDNLFADEKVEQMEVQEAVIEETPEAVIEELNEQEGEDNVRAQGERVEDWKPKKLAIREEPAIETATQPVAPTVAESSAIELRPGLTVTKASIDLLKQLAVSFDKGGLYQARFPGGAPQIFTVCLIGLEMGLSPQVALNSFFIIEGKPSPSAHLLIALAKRDPQCEYIECVEENADSVTYETKKKNFPRELRFTYSLKDAKQDNMKWARDGSRNQRALLRKTAGSQAARLWYPEACNGLYSTAELSMDDEAGQHVG